jgi:hypothetical protein
VFCFSQEQLQADAASSLPAAAAAATAAREDSLTFVDKASLFHTDQSDGSITKATTTIEDGVSSPLPPSFGILFRHGDTRMDRSWHTPTAATVFWNKFASGKQR